MILPDCILCVCVFVSCLEPGEPLNLVPVREVGEAVMGQLQPREAGQGPQGPCLDVLEAAVAEAEALDCPAAVE